MSHQTRISYPSARRSRQRTRCWPRSKAKCGLTKVVGRVVGYAAYMLLGLAVIALVAGIASCASSISSAPGAGAGSEVAATAPLNGDAWIPLRSQAPADILAAARSGPLFRESDAGGGDGAPDLSRLGSPVFVQALRSVGATPDQMPDFYVVPILNDEGATTDAAELALNPSHTAVQENAIVTYAAPRAGGTIPLLTADQAVQTVVGQRHEAAQAMGHPYLAYFTLDSAAQPRGRPERLDGGRHVARRSAVGGAGRGGRAIRGGR